MRCFRANILVRPLPELHRDIDTGIVSGATITGYQLTGRKGNLAFGEVVDMGPGGLLEPSLRDSGRSDMPEVRPGARVIFDLGDVSKELVVGSEKLFMMNGPDLRAEYLGPHTAPRPLMNQVLTARDPKAFLRAMYPGLASYEGMELPEGVLRDGMPTDAMRVSRLKFVYERVIAAGPGRVVPVGRGQHVKFVFSPTPEDFQAARAAVVSPLVMFSPVRSLSMRIGGLHLKLTPFSDLELEVEALAGAA